MTAKEYLQRVAHAEREIKTIQARLRHYREMGLGSPGNMTNTPVTHSKGSSTTEMAAIGIVDTLNALNANLGAYTVIVDDAEKLIEKVPQETYRRLLTLRYLCGMSFRSVSDELNYTDRNSIYRAHGYALLEFGKVMRLEQK